ncbi:MAG: LpxL/LpxP family Kdo(2)-lipid IV(A) lauroyl/palmitoleoyl acyltransferase [Hahellaceae bacterium]|nr:LpxL/LpxP family Kdo(2)-lipid IV(A) lauroyl/palmitoleoyl acyltransferase [Hahellaceae bacterium]MCP5168651.1 LpxL/LpxP family Kdo(2)-lipid IV(A) lauroyl/palmitoleoyl acyltransferase [Hahellaceae bacterium]
MRYTQFLHPKFWSSWCMVFLVRLLASLPLRLQQWLGQIAGLLGYCFWTKRRKIAQTNIGLCFPQLDAKAQTRLVRATFVSNGIGLLETATGWFRNPERLRDITYIHGHEHIEKALSQGRGVILLGGQYSTLELGGTLISLFLKNADILQRAHKNPLYNAVMTRSRRRYYGVLDRKDLRGMLRSLKANRVVWYATDQDNGRKNSVFAPFFGTPAATLTSTARIARKTGAAVVPFSHFRRNHGLGYDIYFHEPLRDFPTDDEELNATRINQIIEGEIRKHPEQYLWTHRRFKTTPVPHTTNPYHELND